MESTNDRQSAMESPVLVVGWSTQVFFLYLSSAMLLLSVFVLPMKMKKNWVLGFLFFLRVISSIDCLDFNGGFGVGVDDGGSVWMSEGIEPPPAFSSPNPNRAYSVLQAWKSAIVDDPSGILKTWVGSNVCSYKGVFCEESLSAMDGSEEPVIAGIDLNHANLRGTLVEELGLLAEMNILHLNSNRFSGRVSESFRNLDSLRELDLSNNQFAGPFPTSIIPLQNLIYLDLRFNFFSGPIPEDLFDKKLDAIFLNNNGFEGELPQNLGNSPASVINLANNKFSGNIPFSVGFSGSQLEEILFLNNQLTGCIPEGLGLFTDIQVFDASFNSLTGHLPDTVSCLNEIEVLNVAHNKLSGLLPDFVCSLRKLVNLTVSYNFFSGFDQACAKANPGFDFAENCIFGRNSQRRPQECSGIGEDGLNCLRMPPIGNPFDCRSIPMRRKSGSSSLPLPLPP